MNRDLKPYPEYTDSGVPWLGKVPRHWAVAPLKRRTRLNQQSLSETTDPSYRFRYLDIGSVGQGNLVAKPEVMRFGDAPSRARRLVNTGDTIVSTVRTYLKAVFYVRDSAEDLIASTGFAVLSPDGNFEPEYLGYVARSESFVNSVVANSVGVAYPAIAETRLGCLPIAMPPERHEQRQICRFLGNAESLINRFIRNKRRLIALLREQKQAIINQAVTRGIDPNVPLKPSGIPWIPQMCEGWTVVQLRRLIDSAIDGPHFSPSYVDQGIPFISARNIKVDRWNLSDARYISEANYSEFCKRVIPEPGDVLYTKGGTTGVARVVDLNFRFQVWVHVAVLKVRRSLVDPTYLALALNSSPCYAQSQLYTRGATNQDLGLNRMKNIYLHVPERLEQQRAIVEHVKSLSTDLIAAISHAERKIELMNEYRTRLIADVVTGKVDVRGVEIDESFEFDLADDETPADEYEDTELSDSDEPELEDA